MDKHTALLIAIEFHKGQTDKAGAPYISHPIMVASMVSDEKEKVIALLHDVLEDTDCTIEDLYNLGITEEQAEALLLLTHDPEIEYFDYIKKISTNALAKTVKLADLKHNMDLKRLSNVTPKDIKRLEKYKKAYIILSEANK